MGQDINNMGFCERCGMNVFPTRQRFNIKVFGAFAILMVILFTTITLISLSILSEILLSIFLMWGFMIINPYLLYYGLQKKNYCPRCYDKTSDKNLEYKPFGEKEPDLYEILTPSEKSIKNWHCPYCGNSISDGAVFCGSCGKKFEILR